MALIAPAERVRKLLAVTKLDSVFKLFGSERRPSIAGPRAASARTPRRAPPTDSR